MANFESRVVKIGSKMSIPNSDRIAAYGIDGYVVVDGVDRFEVGDVAVYISEDSVVPDDIIAEMNLTGRLAGTKHNRVKAIMLRGQLSQGLLYTGVKFNKDTAVVGEDYASRLGIIKYVPQIPTHLAGDVYNLGREWVYYYDVENVKRYPDLLTVNDMVRVEEKIHGTQCCVVIAPDTIIPCAQHNSGFLVIDRGPHEKIWYSVHVGSKTQMGENGLAFQWTDSNMNSNAYLRAIMTSELKLIVEKYPNHLIQVYGEVYGNVQDLTYSVTGVDFRMFDVRVRDLSLPICAPRFLSDDELTELEQAGVRRVPILYRGPYDIDAIRQFTQHTKSKVDDVTMMEGGVIKPAIEQRASFGRLVLKDINIEYSARKNKNATEYQ